MKMNKPAHIIKIVFLLVALILARPMTAQVEMSISGGLMLKPMDQDAEVYYKQKDSDDNVCALIKVKTTNPMGATLVLQTGGGIVPVKSSKQADGSWWYWISPKTRNIFFTADGYTETARLGVHPEAGKVYELTLTVSAAITVIQTTTLDEAVMKLSISPEECVVSYGKDDSFDMGRKTIKDGYFEEILRNGTYQYKIENPFYEPYVGTYVLNSSSLEQTITLRPAFGMLCIESDPSGADVYLDGAAQPVGKTPYTTGKLLKGKHQFQLYKEDYYGYNTELEVLPDGEEQKIPTIQLRPQFGWVTCQCEDPEALLTVTDARGNVMGKGKSGLKVKLNSKGDYKLEAFRSSYASQSVPILGGANIEGKNILVQVGSPVPLYGTLQLTTEPTKADVFVDGKEMGTSTIIKQFLIGEHSIELRKDGYQPMKFSVNIQKDERVVVNKTLSAAVTKKTIVLITENAYLYLDGKELAFRSWTGKLEIGRKYKVTTHFDNENYKDGELEISITEYGPNSFKIPSPTLKSKAIKTEFVDRGLEHSVDVSYAYVFSRGQVRFVYSGFRDVGNTHPIELDYTLSYRFSRVFSLGAGVGVLYHLKSISIVNDNYIPAYENFQEKQLDVPLFARLKLNFLRTNVRPMLNLQAGYYCISGVFYGEAGVGVDFRMGKKSALQLSVSARTAPWPRFNEQEGASYVMSLAPALKLGFSF